MTRSRGVSLELVRAYLATDPNRRFASGRGWSVYRHGLPTRSFERRIPVNHATNALGLSFRGFEFDAVSVRIRARFGSGYDSGHAPTNPVVRRRAPARVSKGTGVSRATAPARAPRGPK